MMKRIGLVCRIITIIMMMKMGTTTVMTMTMATIMTMAIHMGITTITIITTPTMITTITAKGPLAFPCRE